MRILPFLILLSFKLWSQDFDYQKARALSIQPDKEKLLDYLNQYDRNISESNQVYYNYFHSLYYRYTGNRDEQIAFLIRGFNLFERNTYNDSIKAMYLDEFALVYKTEEGKLQEAIQKIDESISIKKKVGDDNALSKSYLIKANIYYLMDEVPSHLDTVKYYYKLVQKHNTTESYKYLVLSNLAAIAIDENKLEDVEKAFSEVYQYNIENGFFEDGSLVVNNLASFYNEAGQYSKAEIILDTLLDYVSKNNFTLALREILINKGNLYENLGDYKQAAFGKIVYMLTRLLKRTFY